MLQSKRESSKKVDAYKNITWKLTIVDYNKAMYCCLSPRDADFDVSLFDGMETLP